MHSWSKFGLILALFLAMPGCGPLRQISPPPGGIPSGTPSISVTDTATPLSATPAPAPTISSLKMIDAENGWVWTSSNRLLRTTDGGQSWLDRTPGGQVWSEGFFALDVQTAWLPIISGDNNRFGLLHTTDGGQTWTEFPYGPTSGLHFTDALNGWAEPSDAGAGSIYYSLSQTRDCGKIWAPVQVTPPYPDNSLPPGTVHLRSSDSFYFDPARMVVVYGDMITMKSSGSVQMQVSFDLGKTWLTQNLPLPKGYADALVSPYRPAFFGDKSGLLPVSLVKWNNDGSSIYERLVFYTSQDGGATWTLSPSVLNVARYTPMQIVSSRDIYVLCGKSMCASHDGAQTWQALASNLDLTQTDSRSVSALDFVDASTGWVLSQENELSALYKTIDGGLTWNRLTPMLAASAPVKVTIDTSIPTPTLIPTPTFELTPTPNVAFDPQANAYRIRFAPFGTWVDINATVSANTPKRYILSAMQGQVMSVSILQGAPFSVQVAGADGKDLNDSRYPLPFWRGALPSKQDYFVSIESQASGPFTLRIAINPPGQATQNFASDNPQYLVIIGYTDEFAPTTAQVPAASTKGTPLFTLAFIDSSFYYPRTNLNEAYLLLTASKDPGIVSACTQPSTQVAETVTGQVSINNYTFTRSEFSGAAAGNIYDQVSYRTVVENKCFEVIFLSHSSNIGNYPAGTVVEYDHAALLSKFEAVLDTFLAK